MSLNHDSDYLGHFDPQCRPAITVESAPTPAGEPLPFRTTVQCMRCAARAVQFTLTPGASGLPELPDFCPSGERIGDELAGLMRKLRQAVRAPGAQPAVDDAGPTPDFMHGERDSGRF